MGAYTLKGSLITKVNYKEVEVKTGDQRITLHFQPATGVGNARPSSDWIVRKVVCGSKGNTVLFADSMATGMTHIINRYDSEWRLISSDTFTLPQIKLQGYKGGTLGRLIWRFVETPQHYEMVLLDIGANDDRTINPSEYIAFSEYSFWIAKRSSTPSGFADLPGPALTPAYFSSLPVEVMPGVTVSKSIERHEVYVYGGTGTVRVRVKLTNAPVFLSLSAGEPVEWTVTTDPGVQLPVVYVHGHHKQKVVGLTDKALILDVANRNKLTSEQETALLKLLRTTASAKSKQQVNLRDSAEVIPIDGIAGKLATESAPTRNIHHPNLGRDLPQETLVRIANCKTLENQDERIECYRERAKLLRQQPASIR